MYIWIHDKTPPQSSNSVNGREKYFKASRLLILKDLCVVVAWPSCTKAYFLHWRRLGCRFKSRRGYLQVFFSFFFNIVFLLFGLLPFILICRPFLASRDFCDKVFLVSNFGPLQRMSRTTKHVSKAGKVDPGVRVTLPVKFACKPELTLTGLLE